MPPGLVTEKMDEFPLKYPKWALLKIKETEKNKPLSIATIAVIPKYVLLGSKYYYSEMGILEIKTHAWSSEQL